MNYYVDMHSNLLPGLAGLENRALTEQEAEERLAVFRQSNVKLAVAAPVFRPSVWDVKEFLALRDEKITAAERAAAERAASEQMPQPLRIVSGAVLPLDYCMEFPRTVRQFALGDTDYFLVDLPRTKITEDFCEALSRLRIVSGLCPVAVDIDRFFDIWTPEEWITLRQTGMLLQISVNGLLEQKYRKLSLYMLANQYAHFVATGSRRIDEPLRFADTMRVVQRSLPAQLYRRVKNNPGMLLSNAEPSAFYEK